MFSTEYGVTNEAVENVYLGLLLYVLYIDRQICITYNLDCYYTFFT